MSGAGPPDPRRPAARRRARRCRAPGPRAREGAAHLSGWATLERRPSRHRLLGRGLERSHGRRHGAEPERLLSIRGHQSVYRPARRIQHAAAENRRGALCGNGPRGRAVPQLLGVPGQPHDARRTDVRLLPRARGGDHGSGARPGVVRRRQWRDRRHLCLAEQDARRLRGAAALVGTARRRVFELRFIFGASC